MARLCRQLRDSVHHILVGSESRSSRRRSALGFELWWTERELQEALGHMPRACERKAASLQRHDLTHTVHDVPTMPMHEVLAKELCGSATVPFKLEEARENGTLPRAYWDHPVVKASSTPVWPMAVFMDGVAYSHTDSLLGVWAINIDQHDQPEAPLRCPESQEANVQVRVPGMVFPVPSHDRASLVRGGRYVWEHVDISRQFCSKACLRKSML